MIPRKYSTWTRKINVQLRMRSEQLWKMAESKVCKREIRRVPADFDSGTRWTITEPDVLVRKPGLVCIECHCQTELHTHCLHTEISQGLLWIKLSGLWNSCRSLILETKQTGPHAMGQLFLLPGESLGFSLPMPSMPGVSFRPFQVMFWFLLGQFCHFDVSAGLNLSFPELCLSPGQISLLIGKAHLSLLRLTYWKRNNLACRKHR